MSSPFPLPFQIKALGAEFLISLCSCLFSIPVSAEILDSLGSQIFVILFGAFLTLALAAFATGRWTCQGYHWKWKAIL